MKKLKKKSKKILIFASVAVALAVAGLVFALTRGGGAEEIVYVQSVADLTGQGAGVMLGGRYSGVVEAKEIIKIKLDEDKKLNECFVKVGDKVSPGTPLFSYDVDSLTLAYEQLKLDYEGKKNNIATMRDQIKDLEKQIKRAKGATKAELTIQLQTTQLNLKKEEYEAEKKRLDVEKAESVIKDNVVKAETAGTIRSITPPTGEGQQNYDGMQTDNAYMTIVAGNDYRVKGTISEQGAYQLMSGTPVIIRSRIDETKTWRGTIDSVNTEQPVSNQQQYYDGGNGEQASKYAFYIALETVDGLMMGQHVYIEMDEGQSAGGLMLPKSYIVEENGKAFVFVAGRHDRIEKRAVTLGAYNEELDAYEIVSGLSLTDRIAFPDESVKAGMTAVDAGYASAEPAGMEPDGDGMPDAGRDGSDGLEADMEAGPAGETGMAEPAPEQPAGDEDEAQDGAEG